MMNPNQNNTPVDFTQLPDELKMKCRYCVWKKKLRHSGKPAKVPYNPKTDKRADCSNPSTFGSLADVLNYAERGYDGIGVLVSELDGDFRMVAVDIDDCIDAQGRLSELADAIIRIMRSYTEVSPSGYGIRILCKVLRNFICDNGKYYINNPSIHTEVYDSAATTKYVTLTGRTLTPGVGLEQRENELLAVLEKYMVRPERLAPQPQLQQAAPVSGQQSHELRPEDLQVIESCNRGSSGEKFAALWNGDTSVCGSDHSAADMAFCNIVGARTQDPEQIQRIFRNSGLMRPKWDRPTGIGTYGSITVQKAISSALAYRQQLEQQKQASLASPLPPVAVPAQQVPQQPATVPAQQIPQRPSVMSIQEAFSLPSASVPAQQMVPQQPMATGSPLPALLANKGISVQLPTPAAAQQLISRMQWQIPISADELQKMNFPEPEFLIDGLLTVGLALLVAPPKAGKSQFCDAIALSIAMGAPILGRNTTQAGVLYAALEDQYGRIRGRMNQHLDNCAAPPKVHYLTDLPQTDTGLYARLDSHLAMHPDTKLVIIDVLQRVRGKTAMQGNNYLADSRELSALKQYADLRNICVLLVHHNRKMVDENDVYNQISGTTGLMGAADTVLMITTQKRSKENAILHVTGRDIPDQSLVIRFDRTSLCWELVGTADEVSAEEARKEYENNPTVITIRELVKESPDGKWRGTATELMNAGVSRGRVLAVSAKKMGQELTRLYGQMEANDGIHHGTVNTNANGGKAHVFTSLARLQANLAKNEVGPGPSETMSEEAPKPDAGVPDNFEHYEDDPYSGWDGTDGYFPNDGPIYPAD